MSIARIKVGKWSKSSILIEKVAAVVAFHGIIFLHGINTRT